MKNIFQYFQKSSQSSISSSSSSNRNKNNGKISKNEKKIFLDAKFR